MTTSGSWPRSPATSASRPPATSPGHPQPTAHSPAPFPRRASTRRQGKNSNRNLWRRPQTLPRTPPQPPARGTRAAAAAALTASRRACPALGGRPAAPEVFLMAREATARAMPTASVRGDRWSPISAREGTQTLQQRRRLGLPPPRHAMHRCGAMQRPQHTPAHGSVCPHSCRVGAGRALGEGG